MKKFIDIDISLGIHPETKDILIKKGSNAVSQSLRNLVLSNKYDHPFQPSIGANLRSMLFELASKQTDEAISQMISDVINNHEPRVRVEKVDVISTQTSQNLDVVIFYYEVEIPTLQSLKLTIQRVR